MAKKERLYRTNSNTYQLLQICKAPSTHCTAPKKTVNTSTRIATQNVYHCTPFLRSHHHCPKVRGSDSSKTCLSTTSLSCQYSNLSICRSWAFRYPHLIASGSKFSRRRSLRYHDLVALLCSGKRRARVRRVSSMKQGSKIGRGLPLP